MKIKFFMMLIVLVSMKVGALTVCNSPDNCDLYLAGEGGQSNEVHLFNKAIFQLPPNVSSRWEIVRGNHIYYLSIWSEQTNDLYLLRVNNICKECSPMVGQATVISLNRNLQYRERPNVKFLAVQGVGKAMQENTKLEDFASIMEVLANLVAPVDKVKITNKNTNIFYVGNFSPENEYVGEKLLYSPPIKAGEISPLFFGCIDGCEFKDLLLQSDAIKYELFGDINGKMGVMMELTKLGGRLQGQYCYLKNCKDFISLNGTIDEKGVVFLEESVKNKVTGSMELTLVNKNTLEGSWISVVGKKLPMLLVRSED